MTEESRACGLVVCSQFMCYYMPASCADTEPPLAVKLAASFLQPLMSSSVPGGVLQFSYYAMLGYPGPPKAPLPSSATVSRRLREFGVVGRRLRGAAHAFLGQRRDDLLVVCPLG